MKHLYFKAESGPLYQAMVECIDKKRKAVERARELCQELGASSGCYADRGLIGFVWGKNQGTVPKHLKGRKSRHTHDDKGRQIMIPDKRFKAGKQLSERMARIKFPDTQQAGAEVLRCRSQWIPANDPRSSTGMSIFSYAFGFIREVALAKVPVAEAGDGVEDDAAHDWQPPDIEGLVQITHGEFVDLSEANKRG